jgi:hypothetical protein
MYVIKLKKDKNTKKRKMDDGEEGLCCCVVQKLANMQIWMCLRSIKMMMVAGDDYYVRPITIG